MKTGLGRSIRYRATTAIALTTAVALPLVLSGCEDHSPVAAPTSTLPAQDPVSDPSETNSQPEIPEYETDLDLSAEEKEAVDGALVAFEGFLFSINRAYSGDFEKMGDFSKYASGEALGSIKDEAESIQTKDAVFEGEISPISVEIFDVSESDGAKDPLSVVVHFCVDTTKWSVVQEGSTSTTNPDGLVTMEHEVLLDRGTWKVNGQSLWERKC